MEHRRIESLPELAPRDRFALVRHARMHHAVVPPLSWPRLTDGFLQTQDNMPKTVQGSGSTQWLRSTPDAAHTSKPQRLEPGIRCKSSDRGFRSLDQLRVSEACRIKTIKIQDSQSLMSLMPSASCSLLQDTLLREAPNPPSPMLPLYFRPRNAGEPPVLEAGEVLPETGYCVLGPSSEGKKARTFHVVPV